MYSRVLKRAYAGPDLTQLLTGGGMDAFSPTPSDY